MAINVTCPGCHKRFSVSDKFAGQKGPCPKCKTVMEIPKPGDEVVIHAPDETSGPKDARGRSVLKTARRKDAKFNPVIAGSVGAAVLVILVAAIVLRGSNAANMPVVLGAGAVLLGPLLAWAGYPFLRDQELEAYAGRALWVRSIACGLGFAAAWGVYAYLAYVMSGGWPIGDLTILKVVFATAVAIGIGAFASMASLDLDLAVGGVHFAFYFLVTIGLRVILGLTALPGLASG